MLLKKKIMFAIIGVVITIAAVAGGYGYIIYSRVEKTANAIYEPLAKDKEVKDKPIAEKVSKPFSILMLGVDTGEYGRVDQGRSDSMMLITVNPKEQSTKVLSIARDSRTEIVGKGIDDKINHAYAFGGIDMSVKTVEKFMNVPIDYYIVMNMGAFEDTVTAVNGVDINNPFHFVQNGVDFPAGPQHINGKQALEYARMRHEDPNGDFGRQARQRQMLKAVLEKGATLTGLSSNQALLTAVTKNIKTNLTIDNMIALQQDYKNCVKNVEDISMEGEGKRIDNIYYQVIPDSLRVPISQKLRTHLGL